MWCRGARRGILKTTIKTSSRQGNWKSRSHWGCLLNSTNPSSTNHCQMYLLRDRSSRQAFTAATVPFTVSSLLYPHTTLPSLQTVSPSVLQPQWAIRHLLHIPASVLPSTSGNPRLISRSLPLRLLISVSLSSMLARRVSRSWSSWMTCCRVCRTTPHYRVVRDRRIGV